MTSVSIIGAGPAGLMAAEKLAARGFRVTIYDHKPSPARKFLMAGRGGLNITHSEPFEKFISRYGEASDFLCPVLEHFPPEAVRNWCAGLGEETFVGTSGRVFPKSFKASPLLRAWLKRLADLGVEFKFGWRWIGWNEDGHLLFLPPPQSSPLKGEEVQKNSFPLEGGRLGWGCQETVHDDITILALGGASWPRLGSDGHWTKLLEQKGIHITPLRPANCGFITAWSDIFKNKYAGQPLKSVILTHSAQTVQSDVMITAHGVEGGGIYALSKSLRTSIETDGEALLTIDLKHSLSREQIASHILAQSRGRDSFSNFLRKTLGLSSVAIGLLQEDRKISSLTPSDLAERIKAYPVQLTATAPLDRAISSAGGIALSELDENLQLKKCLRVYAIGEMLDWEAPTGGYLLQACLSMGAWLGDHTE